MKLSRIIELDNLADHLDEEQLRRIGEDVVEGYKRDLQSREAWEEKNADALKLALQFSEKKTFPWPNASNIKYPLVLLSCVQFNSRAYPAMVPGERVVEIRKSPKMDLQAAEMAIAASDEMNWQIMEGGEDDNWEDGHDLMLMMVPLIGTVFKKTYYDAEKGKNCSYPILPSNFVVDYWAKNLVQCARKTHVHQFDENHVESQKRLEYYRDVEYGKHVPQASETQDVADDARGFERPQTQGYTFLEQCCWIDLDEDGYKEPYVVTVDLASRQVARIVENFKEITLVRNGIRLKIKPGEYNDDMAVMKVAKITEQQYYTKYGFIRSPDGGFYDVGLGTLLSPTNHAVDTLINQLTDAGTLAVAGGGLLSRNIRTRSGKINGMPGVFIRTEASAEELRNGIYPWPVREPSNVLFQMLSLLLDAGQKIGSVSDTMMGKAPGQNQAATTTLTVLEQGLQVFSSIYKRIFRSMSEEFRKWYALNAVYGEQPELYSLPLDLVRPTADPNAVAQAQKMLKAEALVNRAGTMPHLYGFKGALLAEKRYLEALNIPDAAELLGEAKEPGPNPEATKIQMEQEFKEKEFQFRVELETAKEQREQERTRSTIMKDKATVATKLANAQLSEEKQAHQEVMDQLNFELSLLKEVNDKRRMDRLEKSSRNEDVSD